MPISVARHAVIDARDRLLDGASMTRLKTQDVEHQTNRRWTRWRTQLRSVARHTLSLDRATFVAVMRTVVNLSDERLRSGCQPITSPRLRRVTAA
ncbi:hypothetical protein LOC71_18880 [Rhodopirellula sp. JC740]|uniref:Transposase DDE domain-containing protein n=1 Tax=Rhodopirellula halodulae TaxID=2894198 RepID=A0ABS8NN33_9BACT|nr:hypothetical protein [Rhodopirellula sp. JC740]MCC9644347.1 hypothetical protein [Rhodopirellula sp. JC740]